MGQPRHAAPDSISLCGMTDEFVDPNTGYRGSENNRRGAWHGYDGVQTKLETADRFLDEGRNGDL